MTFKVRVEFEDTAAFTAKEIEESYKYTYGKNAKIEVLPRNSSPEAAIRFGIQNLVTLDQLELYYEFYPHLYPDKLKEYKKGILKLLEKIVDQVFEDNEKRVKE